MIESGQRAIITTVDPRKLPIPIQIGERVEQDGFVFCDVLPVAYW